MRFGALLGNANISGFFYIAKYRWIFTLFSIPYFALFSTPILHSNHFNDIVFDNSDTHKPSKDLVF